MAIIEYANGVRAALHMNLHGGIPERRLYILGTLGAVRSDLVTCKIEVAKVGFNETIQDELPGIKGAHGGGDDILCASLINTMLHGKPPKTSIREGLFSAITCFATFAKTFAIFALKFYPSSSSEKSFFHTTSPLCSVVNPLSPYLRASA